MSRYTYPGKKPRYRISLGWDIARPLPSLFGSVEDLAWRTDGQVIEASGCTVVRLGSSNPPLTDLQLLVAALAPYGQVPLDIQLQLLSEMDTTKPLTLTRLGKELAAICRQSSLVRLSFEPPTQERVFLVVQENGWQMRYWHTLGEAAPDQAFADLLFPGSPDVRLEALDGYVRADPKITCRFHDDSDLPVFALFARGFALSGPVAISNETMGLTAEQVSLVEQEVFFVEPTLRDQVTRLWSQAYRTLGLRDW